MTLDEKVEKEKWFLVAEVLDCIDNGRYILIYHGDRYCCKDYEYCPLQYESGKIIPQCIREIYIVEREVKPKHDTSNTKPR